MVDTSTLSSRTDEVVAEMCDVIDLLEDGSCKFAAFFNKADICPVDAEKLWRGELEPARECLEEWKEGGEEGGKRWKVFGGSAKTGEGVEEMFAWLAGLA